MSQNALLEFAGLTDTGLVRTQNEDAIAINPARGLAVLADGMGGYNAGEVASRIAVDVMQQTLEPQLERFQAQAADLVLRRDRQLQQLMAEAVQNANAAILAAARKEPSYEGMGTTLVATLVHHGRILVAHVGDSRAYRWRHGQLIQLTRDHSLLQEQIDAGLITEEAARLSANRNLVTRAVGVAADVDIEIHEHGTEAGDIYLLCSDGLSDMVADSEIAGILASHRGALDAACAALVQTANQNGGRDNISVITMKVGGNAREGRLLDRFLRWVV
jgi:PPM family protein phosphatase